MSRDRWLGLVMISVVIILVLQALWNLTSLNCSPNRKNEADRSHREDITLMIDDSGSRALRERTRVLCWIPSTEANLQGKVKVINETWVPRCNGYVFFIETKKVLHDVVSLDTPSGYYNLTAKSFAAIAYLYRHYLHQYDWFLKGDDDAYVIVENLRFVLAHYDPSTPVYLGHLYKRFHRAGYMSGGASYVFSSGALKLLYEEGYKKNKCVTTRGYEDAEVGKCMHSVGISSHNTRDRFGRDTFHPLRPKIHIVGPIPAEQEVQDRFPMIAGPDCCSQMTVSFHKLEPDLMRVVHHLLYRTSVYGRVLDLEALTDFLHPGPVSPLS